MEVAPLDTWSDEDRDGLAFAVRDSAVGKVVILTIVVVDVCRRLVRCRTCHCHRNCCGPPGKISFGSARLRSPRMRGRQWCRSAAWRISLGGGESVSSPAVVRIDPSTRRVRRLPTLDEPLSDLGAAVVRGRTYLVGGYTGARYASAVLRVDAKDRTHVVARLPAGTRYAGIAALGDQIYVAGGVTESGASDAVYRVDVRSGRVSRAATLPRPTAHAPLVAASGALWLIGGDGSRSVFRIELPSGRVSVAARLPRVLANAAAVAMSDGLVVVLGGDGSDAVLAFEPTH